jgi:hypothetical protein
MKEHVYITFAFIASGPRLCAPGGTQAPAGVPADPLVSQWALGGVRPRSVHALLGPLRSPHEPEAADAPQAHLGRLTPLALLRALTLLPLGGPNACPGDPARALSGPKPA